MEKTMANAEIYALEKALNSAFNEEDRYFPATINFYIQKNRSILASLREEIETVRLDIIKKYGVIKEDGTYTFSDDNLQKANLELSELLNIKQDLHIFTIPLARLDGVDFTPRQMQALLFMIEED